MLELRNLAFEVADVLGGVGVIELALDLALLLLLAEHNRADQRFSLDLREFQKTTLQ